MRASVARPDRPPTPRDPPGTSGPGRRCSCDPDVAFRRTPTPRARPVRRCRRARRRLRSWPPGQPPDIPGSSTPPPRRSLAAIDSPTSSTSARRTSSQLRRPPASIRTSRSTRPGSVVAAGLPISRTLVSTTRRTRPATDDDRTLTLMGIPDGPAIWAGRRGAVGTSCSNAAGEPRMLDHRVAKRCRAVRSSAPVAPATACKALNAERGARRRRRASRWRGRRRRRRRRAWPAAQASARRCRRRAPRRSRGRRAALATSAAGTPRGDGAVQATTTSNSSARSASSIAVGSRSVPTTRMRRPSGSKSSKNTWAHVSAPGGLWAPSTITSGWWPSTSNRPGITTAANPSSTTSSASGAAKNASTAVERDRRVVALVGAVQRHEHLGVDRRRRADVDEPAAEGELVAGDVEVVAAQRARAAAGASASTATRSGSVSPITAAESGLMIPAFSPGDVGQRRPGELVVVHADVGDDGDLRVDHVGRVPAPEQADLDHGDVDGDVGEPAERRRRARLEVARPHAGRAPRGRRRRRSARRSRRR